MRTLALLFASAVVAIAFTVGSAWPATHAVSSALCTKGSVKAVIAGHSTCLKSGAKCRARYAAQYRKHGFVCKNGRLAKASPPPPAGPVFPKLPPLPTGPDTTKVSMPGATGLPAGATTISLQTSSWVPDITDLALTSDAVWVSSGPFRIDPADNAVSGPFSSIESQDIGTGEGSVWLSNYNEDTVRRLDASNGHELAVIKLPPGSAPVGVVDAAGSVWVATHHGGTLVRIDPATNRVAATVVLTRPGPSGPQGVAAGLGSVWVDVPRDGVVFRVDPATNKIAAIIPLPVTFDPCGGIAVGQSAVWVTGCLDLGIVARIDPTTNKVASVLDVGGLVVQPAADGDSVWFVTGGDPDASPNTIGYLVQLRADDTVARRIQLGPGFISGGTAVAFGSVWVSDFAHPRVIRVPSS